MYTRLAAMLGAAIAVAALAAGAARRSGDAPAAPANASSTLESLDSPAGPGSAEPNLTVAPDGRVFMSWLEPADSAFSLRFASLNGSDWTEARTIRTGRDFFVNWADFPSLEVLGDGTLAAHWLQRTGTGTYAYGVRVALSRDAGRTWSAPIRPHTDTSNTEHGFVSLWREGNDNALGAVWLDGRRYNKDGHHPSNEMVLATTTLRSDGRVAVREQILDERVCDCCQTSVAMTARGPIIVYRDRSPGEIRDISAVRRVEEAGGAGPRWTAPVPVHDDGWKIAACPVNGPAVDAEGHDVAVAWFTAANDSARVKLAFSRDAGATFGAPIRVDGGQPAGRVDVELLPGGSALVSWIERTGGDTAAVRVRHVRRDGTSSAPVTIASSSAARASGFPRMVVAGREAIFAWTLPVRPSQVRVARLPLAGFGL